MRILYPFNAKDPKTLYQLNEQGQWGFYPVGENRFWHGGIHLKDPARPVTAIADGEIVAYRVTRDTLPYEPSDGRGEPYSNNFVLMRHTLTLGEKPYTFYSLCMHLLPLGKYSQTQKEGTPSIFRQKEYFVATRGCGAGLRLRSAERKEQILCVIPKGAVVERLDDLELDLRWPIEQQKAPFTSVGYQDFTGYAWLDGRSKHLGNNRYLITTAEDRPAPEEMGLSIHETRSPNSPVIGILPHGCHIPLRTKPKPGQQDLFPLEGEGYVQITPQTAKPRDVISPLEYDEVVTLDPPVKVRAGEILGYGGPYVEDRHIVHLEIFTGEAGLLKALQDESQKRGKNHWSLFNILIEEEFSGDGLCDSKKLLAMIDTNRNNQIDIKEIRDAVRSPYAAELRHLVCCHPSEWSEGADGGKWQRLLQHPWSMSKAEYADTLTHIRNMQFWDKVKGMPDPRRVWHFHPVAFIEEMKKMAVPLTMEEKEKIMRVVSKYEGKYWSCNCDTEFSMHGKVSYAGKVHIGLSWGFIQFTQDGGSLGRVLARMEEKHHNLFVETFGSSWKKLKDTVTAKGKPSKDCWDEKEPLPLGGRSARVQPVPLEAKGPSSNIVRDIWEAGWRERFEAAGKIKEFQDVQREMAIEIYLDRALKLCQQMSIRTAKGIAIAFDRQVNRGSAKSIFLRVTGKKLSFEPLDELQFLEKVRDLYPPKKNGKPYFEYHRIDQILRDPELNEDNYDPETYISK